MRWVWWESVVLLPLWYVSGASSQGYCLATDNTPHLFFATNTAYEFVYDKRISHRSIPGCRPVQIWMLSRHGTSYPSRQKLIKLSQLTTLRDTILYNHDSRRNGELCEEDLQGLRDWKWRGQEIRGDTLADQGRDDMIYQAKRLKTAFPDILDSALPAEHFNFKFSGEEVARISAQAFADELLGKVSPVYLTEANLDTRMSTENCSALRDPETVSKQEFEDEKFRQSALAGGMLTSVSSRLGFRYNLTLDTVMDMYEACSYEKAWEYSKTSPWCAVFTKRDLKVLEYYEDLRHFYRSGYGNPQALRFGCPLVKELMQTFKKTAEDEITTPSGTFYWGDEALLESVMSRLGIANDKRQLPSSLSSLSSLEKRQWRTAFISPFAANIAAVFYKCTLGEANQVMFYINEHIVEYEGCKVGLCSWDYLRTRFSPIVSHSCSYDFCDPTTDSAVQSTISSVLVIGAVLTFKLMC